MLKRVLVLSTLFVHFASVMAIGQNACGSNKLYCLIPSAFHTPASEFNFFNTAFATELSQLPLAEPAAGIIFEFVNGVLTESNEGFGPIMTERAETGGRHKLFLAFTYQQFRFHSIDGNDLENIPIVFTFSTANDKVYTRTNNRFNSTVNQYAFYGTFGLTNRIDVSIAIPVSRISLGVSTTGTEYSTTTNAQASFQQYVAGSASGFGDVILAAKGTAWYGERMALAFGAELRLPSGDALNFLGSGAVGIKPYLALSRKGRVAPHLNLGYQWNGNSVLNINSITGKEQNLPGYFLYYFGADITASQRVTVITDFLGQEFFDSPRVTKPMPVSFQTPGGGFTFASVFPTTGSYSSDNLAIGVKYNPWNRLLVTGNLLIRLNSGGLRANVVPLVGVSYTH